MKDCKLTLILVVGSSGRGGGEGRFLEGEWFERGQIRCKTSAVGACLSIQSSEAGDFVRRSCFLDSWCGEGERGRFHNSYQQTNTPTSFCCSLRCPLLLR